VKKKIGTALEEDLITKLKVLAAKEDKKLSQLIEEALHQYLRRKQGRPVAEETKGALRASSRVVQAIMEEEEFHGA